MESTIGNGCLELVYKIVRSKYHFEKFPRQTTGNDCGVFMIMLTLYVALDAEFDYTIVDMPALRRWWCIMLMENFQLDKSSAACDASDAYQRPSMVTEQSIYTIVLLPSTLKIHGYTCTPSFSDEPSIVASSHPDSPYIWPVHWYFALLHPGSWRGLGGPMEDSLHNVPPWSPSTPYSAGQLPQQALAWLFI
ncbi:unnamed protein product [Boreogadus saida]